MKLQEDLSKRGPIRVAVVGAGLMGSGLVAQLKIIHNIDVILWSSRREDGLAAKAKEVGLNEDTYVFADDIKEAEALLEEGKMILTTDNSLAWRLDGVDAICDCAGNTEAGACINENGLEAGKHIISFNVECDVLLGPYFLKKAKEKGLCYTGTAGDEPGAIMELYNFATFLGFRVVAAGKGKNNPMNVEATPATLKEEAEKKGISPRMLTSFVDATNTMVELNAVANATGLLPDEGGCVGMHATINDLSKKLRTKDSGGEMNRPGTVNFVHGIAPGVFVSVESDEPMIRREMPYLSMGDGPNYIFYRPYHLTNIETPLTIARAVMYNEATIAPEVGYVAHTVAVAKKDMEAGEAIEGIGSATCYGTLVEAERAYEENLLPIGLIVGETKLARPVKKGAPLRLDDVVLDKSSTLVKLFNREHGRFYALPKNINMV
ncbi:NAD(P)H-dependent oxidoreductase [Aedoeadaptatus coli]|uniref:NAD(P)H-dependent oxidoreductase n=1 Tax=Aedoeadaptatus coli TaxID=2058292 RepID=UPI000D55F293|nr:NAD(P)-dependent oxidoreductase [Peptoniphilus coli]